MPVILTTDEERNIMDARAVLQQPLADDVLAR
jgi:hypothetical protein